MKFLFRVFDWRLYIQGQLRKHLKAFAISKRLVTVLLLSDMEEGEEGHTNLSEIKFLIPSQLLFKLFRLSLKTCKIRMFTPLQ